MEKIVLYCKSYRNDVNHVKYLLESINKYNKDNIPFYVSVPTDDMNLFKDTLGSDGYNLISDSEAVGMDLPSNFITQQIVKSEFWKTGVCHNYMMIDSDSYFIRDFYISDLMYDEETPYTVMHECKDLLQFTSRRGMDFVKKSFVEDRAFVQNIFNRKGRAYDFGPCPTIWSSKVWKSLKEGYLDPNGLTFMNLMEAKHCEFHWYGEWLLKKRPIDIVPVEPLFKAFHYREQYLESKQMGENEKILSENFMGIVLDTNWGAPIGYE